MGQKGPSLSKLTLFTTIYFCLVTSLQSYLNEHQVTAQTVPRNDYSLDMSLIPPDTILSSYNKLSVVNGLYLLANKPYSGIVKQLSSKGSLKAYLSIAHGMLHGQYKSYYEDGHPFEVRSYKNNLSTGRHYGYWPGGKTLKFDYTYFDEKREGIQKKWYRNGKPYLFAHFTADHEEGLQQGWRENGKLFLNYVVKDGYTYGLQQSALCYTLNKQKIKPR